MEGKSFLALVTRMQLLTRLQEYKKIMGDKFELVTAFSREGKEKVYVQHRLKEKAKEVYDLIQHKGYIYVCGDAAHMAREVHEQLVHIVADNGNVSHSEAEEIVKRMRNSGQYQVSATNADWLLQAPLTPEQEDVWS